MTDAVTSFFQVWNADYPATVKYSADMKKFTWKYTQFSQFNESDTLLLVSGVFFGSQSTSGEIVVYSLVGKISHFSKVYLLIVAENSSSEPAAVVWYTFSPKQRSSPG